jgi:hypothetical protein
MSNTPDYVDDFGDDEAGLIDEGAIADILEKAQDALRGLGLSFDPAQVSITVQQKQTFALIPALIRPSAKKKLKEDRDAREQFNVMMARNHEEEIKARAEQIRQMTADPDKFAELLWSEEEPAPECEHRAPEGICVLCGAEVGI